MLSTGIRMEPWHSIFCTNTVLVVVVVLLLLPVSYRNVYPPASFSLTLMMRPDKG